MIRVGTDIVETERIKQSIQRTPRFFERIFSEHERRYINSKKEPARYCSAAARFAAKEAFLKAFESGIFSVPLCEISVMNNDRGAPHIVLSGKAAALAKGYEISVSLSHTDSLATATVIAVPCDAKGIRKYDQTT